MRDNEDAMKTVEPESSPLDPSLLAINTEKVCHVVVKARTFDVKQGAADEQSGSNSADDGMTDILEDFSDDATEAIVKNIGGVVRVSRNSKISYRYSQIDLTHDTLS